MINPNMKRMLAELKHEDLDIITKAVAIVGKHLNKINFKTHL